ncbi:MAG: hypothetical protein ACP5M4_01525 [Acidobacteriaceae bacterium]
MHRALRLDRFFCFLTALAVLALVTPTYGQQTQVDRYDLYSGFTAFSTPHLNLTERGYNFQAGVNLRSWLATGFDFAYVSGHSSLTPNMLKPSLAAQIEQQIAALEAAHQLPPGYTLSVPTDSTTQTFAAGPQLSYRRWAPVTLFIRPSLGAVHQTATPHPSPADLFAVAVSHELAPSGKKIDWQGFYGFGGGIDWNLTPHFAIRTQTDVVYWTLFNDLLDGNWTVRYSVGPTFRFGGNILHRR